MAHTKQGLRRGYHVLALEPNNVQTLCWSSSGSNGYKDDRPDVRPACRASHPIAHRMHACRTLAQRPICPCLAPRISLDAGRRCWAQVIETVEQFVKDQRMTSWPIYLLVGAQSTPLPAVWSLP